MEPRVGLRQSGRVWWWAAATLAGIALVLVLGIRSGSCASDGQCSSSIPGSSFVAAAALLPTVIWCAVRGWRSGRNRSDARGHQAGL